MSLQPGRTFAGYRVVRQLGKGGMGEVYLADHPRLPRQDALKILPQGLSGDPMFRKRFTREADIAATLDHPNIVSVFDRGEADGQLWITMKYVDGTDVANLLAAHPRGLPADDVAAIISAVAEALDHAHGQGLLHRDVKPANILITNSTGGSSKRRILLADFGIARPIFDDTHLTSTNLTVGSVAYTSPEQLAGTTLDGRADQYSLACTAYQLLCGATPFANSSAAVLIHQHLASTPPAVSTKRPELSPQVDRVLERALDKQADRRYSSCEHFAGDLAAALRASPSRPAPTPPGPSPQRVPPTSAPPIPQPIPQPFPNPQPVPPTPASNSLPGVPPPPAPTPHPYPMAPAPVRRSNGKATTALVLGILSLTIGWCGLSIVLGPAAIVLGALAMRKTDPPGQISNRGSAVAGVITGVLGILAFLILVLFSVALDGGSI